MGAELQRVGSILEQDEKRESVTVPVPVRIYGKGVPKSPLSVAGGAAVGAKYAAENPAPPDGLIVQGSVGIGTPAPDPRARLQVSGGAIMPSAGEGANAGILFPDNPGGGGGDGAWIRYFARAGQGESTTLEIGLSNDPQDHLALMPSGNVGIGTREPGQKLQVEGNALLNGTLTVRDNVQFANRTRQMLNLWTTEYGIGIQGSTQYFRSGGHFAWYKGGSHNDAALNGGGGAAQMVILDNGNVGVGTAAPGQKLQVEGSTQLNGALTVRDSVQFANKTRQMLNLWDQSYGIGIQDGTQYYRTVKNFAWFKGGSHHDAALNAGGGTAQMVLLENGNVGIGTAAPVARLQVTGGALMPAAGDSEAAGILFPKDPGGGAGDAAWIRYFARKGEETTLEIGVGNDPQDHLALMHSGSLGIGTREPTHKFHVKGPEAVGLFESTGGQAYLRVSTSEGLDNRVEFCNRPGGRLALWVAAGSDALNILRDGNVGIGTTSPQTRLHVKQVDGSGLRIESANGRHALNIYWETHTDNVVFYNENWKGRWMDPAGNWNHNSDGSLKENVAVMDDVLEDVLRLRPVRFSWKQTDGRQIGMIAQDVEPLFPELVSRTYMTGKETLGLSYEGFGVLAVAALQELARESRDRLRRLEARLRELEERSSGGRP